jgi:hypothetical protein
VGGSKNKYKKNIEKTLDKGEKWCIFHLNGDRWVRVGD